MFIQYSDSTEAVIVSCFGNQQDPTIYPNQGTVTVSDPRYATFFHSLSVEAQAGLPAPQQA